MNAPVRFAMTFTAGAEQIDQLGHVNNAEWVRWMEEIAVAHWESAAAPEHQAAFYWVISRHEIDYRGNLRLGQSAVATTWVEGAPKGARFARHIEFRDADGRLLVDAVTTWAMIDRASGRPARVTADIIAPFYA